MSTAVNSQEALQRLAATEVVAGGGVCFYVMVRPLPSLKAGKRITMKPAGQVETGQRLQVHVNTAERLRPSPPVSRFRRDSGGL